MKSKLYRFGILMMFLVSFTISGKLYATHIVGGEIRYDCLGNNQYKISLLVYRDCYFGAADFDNPASIGIFNQNNELVMELSAPIGDVDTLTMDDPCLFIPPDVCVDIAYYAMNVSLPPISGGYKIVYQRCCRNNSVTNIVEPLETGGTYEVELTEYAMAECNSSPKFNSLAPIFICLNKPFQWDHSATDADGDSLVYSFYTPYAGATFDAPQPAPPLNPPYDTVIWVEPYNLNNLMGNEEFPLTINSQTGLTETVPTIQGQFVVGVCVEEYRNGQVLSKIKRDFQFNVGHCGEYVSSFAIPHAQCDDLTVNFDNQSEDSDDYEWYFNYPDDLTAYSEDETPQYVYPDTGTYTIMLIAQPLSVCADTSYKNIFLQYNSLFPNFDITVSECADNSVIAVQDLSFDTISAPDIWEWQLTYDNTTLTSSEQNPFFVIPNGVEAELDVTVTSENYCIQSYQETFETGGHYPGDLIEDTLYICLGESTNLNPNFVTGYTYHWSPEASFSNPFEPNPVVNPDATTVYTVEISGTNDLCQSSVDVTVIVKPLPELDFSNYIRCDGITVEFTNTSSNAEGYLWTFSDGNGVFEHSDIENPVITFPGNGDFTVMLAVDTNALCRDTIYRSINLPERIFNADFSWEYLNCSTEEITITFTDNTVNTMNNNAQWLWQFGDFETSNLQNPVITITEDMVFDVQLTVVTDEDCQDVVSYTLNVDITDDLNFPDTVQICRNSQEALNPYFNPDYTYLWSPSTGLDNPTSPNPIASPSETTVYTVKVTNISEDTCEIIKEVVAFVPLYINVETTEDILTCDLNTTVSVSGNDIINITWTNEGGETVGTDFNLPVVVSGTDVYNVVVENSYGCIEQTSVTVAGGPVSISVSNDETLCSDETLNVFVTNNDPNDILSYNWTPPEHIVSGENTANPIISMNPGIKTVYVEAESQYGCTSQDSLHFIIVDANINLDFDFEIQCNGATVDFTNTSTDAFDFVWDFGDPYNPDTDNSTLDNPHYTYAQAGEYPVMLTIQYDVNCKDTVFHTVVIEEPFIVAGFEYEYESCNEDSVIINFYDVSQNYQNNTVAWEWTANGEVFSTSENSSYTLYNSQSVAIELTITTEVDCSASAAEVLDFEFIEVDLSETIGLCIGDTTQLNPGGNETYEYHWTPETGLSDPYAANPLAFPDVTTTYSVLITNYSVDTCQVNKEVTVVVYNFHPVVSDAVSICWNVPTPINPNAILEYDYLWTPSTGLDDNSTPNPIATLTENQTYSVNISEQYGEDICSGEYEVNVIVVQQLDLEITANPDTLLAGSGALSRLHATEYEGFDYIWAPPESLDNPDVYNPEATPTTTTTYDLEITDDYGCITPGNVTVYVIDHSCGEPYVFVPTAFSPNKDKNNDMVFVRGTNITELYFVIYDRWGQKVFETTDQNTGWDGTFKGKELPPDVYGFYLKATCFNQDEYFKKGNITLLR